MTRKSFFFAVLVSLCTFLFTVVTLLDHSWVRNVLPLSGDPRRCGEQSCELDLEQGCLSPSLMARSQDISFGMGSNINCEVQSPMFTCKSSFSSPMTPSLGDLGFSFHSSASGGSNTLDFSTPLIALPSFAFFGSSSVAEQESDAFDLPAISSRIDLIPRGNFGFHV